MPWVDFFFSSRKARMKVAKNYPKELIFTYFHILFQSDL